MIRLLLAFALFNCGFVEARETTVNGHHLFILSGQSNMRKPLPTSFQECVEGVFGADQVIVVTGGWPSQPIKRWYKNWTPPAGTEPDEDTEYGKLYDQLMNRVTRAIEGKGLESVTFVWMQGEADAGSGWGAVYEKSFLGVLEQLEADLGVGQVRFVIGRINDYWLPEHGSVDGEVVRAAQQKLGEDAAHGDWVDTDGLNTGLNPWGVYEVDGGHFPPSGYRVLGQRFARKACQLVDPGIELDEDLFKERFFHTTADIKSHRAISAKVSGTAPRESGTTGLGILTDGKFGGAEVDDAWLDFGPDQERLEFLVDLGESGDLSAVAVNFLIRPESGAKFPTKLTMSASEDGENFKQVHGKGISFGYKAHHRAKWLEAIESEPLLVLHETNEVKGRYLKIEVETGGSRVLIDEIVVNPAGD